MCGSRQSFIEQALIFYRQTNLTQAIKMFCESTRTRMMIKLRRSEAD